MLTTLVFITTICYNNIGGDYMSTFIDLSNKTFSNWEVLSFSHSSKNNHAMWNCRCKLCGRKYIVNSDSLISGRSTKCRRCAASLSHKKKYSGDPIKIIFKGMKQRCYNKNNSRSKSYYDKGIKICNKWLDNPESFYDWAYQNGYQKGMSIERKDISKDYCPENCCFIPLSEQNKNRSISIMVTINNETKCLSDWCKIYDKKLPTVIARHNKYNMSWEEALKTPLKKKKRA